MSRTILRSDVLYELRFGAAIKICSGSAIIRLYREFDGSDVTTQTVVHLLANGDRSHTVWTFHHD